MSAYSDERLVLEALDDSRPAFEQLVKQYQYHVLRTIASIISDEQAAQDVAQETFLAAWSDLPKLRERHKFGGWLNQIAINLSRHWLRDQRKHHEDTASLKGVVYLMQEQRHDREKLRQRIWEAIDELGEDHREAIILHYISGYSYREISEMLSVPVSTVQGRLQKARNQLRKEFLDMVTKLQLEIDSAVHSFLKEHAKQDGLSVEGLIIRLIERYRRDVDASGAMTRLVWNNAQDFEGNVSPDGRYLSYIHWTMEGNLAIHDFETGKSRNLTDEANWGKEPEFSGASVWSPDSKQIAYHWWKVPGASLRIVGIDGSKPRVLYSTPAESGVLSPRAWSRDGKHILAFFQKKRDKNYDIVLVSVADGSIRVLKSLERPRHSWNRMSLSPDGRYVVYDWLQSEDSSNRDIFLLATDGSHETTLVEHPADDFGPVWAPDGNRIVFISDRSGSMGIWVLEVVDGKPKGYPQLINHNLGKVFPLGVSQDGSYYYGLSGRSIDIYFADLDPETGEVVKPPIKAVQNFEGLNARPDFSPDGKYLAYLRRPRGGGRFTNLVIRSLETGEERELSPELKAFGHFVRWSPDGRSILTLGGTTRENHGIYQIDTETNAATPVVLDDEQGGISVVPPLWSPGGSKIFFMRQSDGIWGIRAYDFETRQEWKPDFQLACGEGYGGGLALSPDGQQLAFMVSCDDEWSLQIAPSSGGDAREIARLGEEEAAWGRGLVWTPDGRYLLFYDEPKDKATGLSELWRIPVEGGEPQNLGLTMKVYMPLSFHPDGSRIAFTGPGPTPGAEVWAMDNFLP